MQSKFEFSLDYIKNDIHKSIIQNLNVMTVKSIQHIISWQYFHKYTQIKLTFIIKLNPELIKTLNKDVIKIFYYGESVSHFLYLLCYYQNRKFLHVTLKFF